MSDTGTQLRARIDAEPTSREALAVYADWLAEHGETTRSEYMQLSLLERPTPAQRPRQHALLAKHRGSWLGAARPFVHTWGESQTSPGFLDWVSCNPLKLAKGFELVRQLGPRLTVGLNTVRTQREIAALEPVPLGTAWGLSLNENDLSWVSDRLLTALAPRLTGLRKLVLAGYAFRVRSFESVIAVIAPTLESLDLHVEYASPTPFLELLLKTPLPRLERLEIGGPVDAPVKARLKATFGAALARR